MPDTSTIRSFINTNVTTNGNGEISGAEVRQVLLSLCDLVDGIYTTYLKVGSNATSTSNGDDIYHTGKLIVGRTTDDGSGAPLQTAGNVSAAGFRFSSAELGAFSTMQMGNGDGAYPTTVNMPGSAKLAVGANYISGHSDIAFVNANLAGDGGFSFWQMLTATTKRALLVLRRGRVGIGTPQPTASLHIKTLDYAVDQFRIEDPYTPANTAEPTGSAGNICWDANYLYIRTPAGWKRTALTTF